jgi:multiple sugar transport system permease protein
VSSKRRGGPWYAYVILVPWAVLMVTPWVWPILTSLKRPADVFTSVLPPVWSLDAYARVFGLGAFPQYLVNSVLVTGALVVINVVVDTMAAYAFAKLDFPLKRTIFGALLVTLMIPGQVNLIPLYRMMVGLHEAVPALGADTLSGIIIPGAVNVFGIFLMRQFFESLPDSMLEAARLDGCSEWNVLRRIVFPVSSPAVATLTVFVLLAGWNDFLWPSIISNSEASRTLPVGLALLAQRNTVSWPETMAASVVTALPMAIAFAILQRRFIDGLTAGAVKDL